MYVKSTTQKSKKEDCVNVFCCIQTCLELVRILETGGLQLWRAAVHYLSSVSTRGYCLGCAPPPQV